MRLLLLGVLFVVLNSGCVAFHQTIGPPSVLLDGRQPGHKISSIAPMLIEWIKFWPINYTRWEGEEKFQTLSICPFGFPKFGESKVRCLQTYWGVKVDGTESSILQQVDPFLWDYVYTPSEQWAFRFHGVGAPNEHDMGGS